MNKYGRCIGFIGLLFIAGAAVSVAGVQFQSSEIKINTTTDGTSYNGGFFTCDNLGAVYAFYNSSRNAIPPHAGG
ncbi:MAG: hypothetical protein NTV79_01070 [Candidatus Aureabacteria bacterium]|nr:hypothetical protein [Candidatus Auribacterota bacterium]